MFHPTPPNGLELSRAPAQVRGSQPAALSPVGGQNSPQPEGDRLGAVQEDK
jgi:hypothetical protein